MKGVYQHCKKSHLHRYLAEFDFRYSKRIPNGIDDTQRAENSLKVLRAKDSLKKTRMTPRKSKPKPDDKEQSARFVETAEQVQSDNAKEAFEEAIAKIAKKKRVTKS